MNNIINIGTAETELRPFLQYQAKVTQVQITIVHLKILSFAYQKGKGKEFHNTSQQRKLSLFEGEYDIAECRLIRIQPNIMLTFSKKFFYP